MNDTTTELQSYLRRIAQKSLNGEIPWSQPNPSTFQWVQISDDGNFLVTIQKAGRPEPRRGLLSEAMAMAQDNSVYLFQVQDRDSRQTPISLSTKERPDVFEALAEIFYGAEKGMDIRAGDVLKRLLNE